MAYIQSHQSLSKHRKTLHMVAALRVDRHKLLGHLHDLWWWGLDNADVNGVVGRVSDEVLAEAAGWPLKDAKQWVEALLEAGGEQSAGFLETGNVGYVLHDWYEYAGKYNDIRARNRSRMQAARSANRPSTQQTLDAAHAPHVPDVSGAHTANGSRLSGATGPERSEAELNGADLPPNPPDRGARPDSAANDDEKDDGETTTTKPSGRKITPRPGRPASVAS